MPNTPLSAVQHLKTTLVKNFPPETDDAIDRCRDVLHRLEEIAVTEHILRETGIGKLVRKLGKRSSDLRSIADGLIDKWIKIKRVQDLIDSLPTKVLKETDNESIQKCRDVIHKLDEISMTRQILYTTHVISKIKKYKDHESLGTMSRKLTDKWRNMLEQEDSQREAARRCWGKPAEALEAFRRCENAHYRNGALRKPDMKAFKDLKEKYLPFKRSYGHIKGVPLGAKFNKRAEAAIVDIHRELMSGIDRAKKGAPAPCYAVCMSGGYHDDESTKSGEIIYTGEGGRDSDHKQTMDQEDTKGNAALMKSYETGYPIRVLCGSSEDLYTYYGLYKCTYWTYEASKDGPMVYKFRLTPIENETIHVRPRGR